MSHQNFLPAHILKWSEAEQNLSMDSTAYDLVQIEIEIATTTCYTQRTTVSKAGYLLPDCGSVPVCLYIVMFNSESLLVEHCTEIIYFLHQICLDIYILE